jgi:hypothetical protein
MSKSVSLQGHREKLVDLLRERRAEIERVVLGPLVPDP